MIKAGLTGGIGSGKTYMAGIFSKLGIPVFNADKIAAEISREKGMTDRIIEKFGNKILDQGDQINRKKLAMLVFDDKDALNTLNGIIHPVVEERFRSWLEQVDPKTPYILKEAAILFESGSNKSLDRTINVYAPLKLRMERTLMRDRHRTMSEVENIISNQMSEEERAKRSDHILVNDDCTPLLPQVEALDKILRDAVH
jgi:dephospho-CoA kinase